ncbi:hypothetical protein GNP88_09915 [Aliivibrio fischeri]|uniref:Histone deacetylase domain-containing protein n=1 Tax=Aliivibrio fischeri TaxID=668 RepID=A0A844P2Q4_ALIFS|nr:hypothetical protein [Aliivibrio fischeri]MUK49487.1 hypothetical protein [Aliivibrio fischeri]
MLALIYHPIYSQLALPDGHRYPIQKYQRLYQAIQSHYSDEFLEAFKQIVEMAINHHQPDLIIYDAGVDIHFDDELGYLNISTEGLYQRDKFMRNITAQKGIPIACVVGGGYRNNHEDLVEPHLQLIRAFVN